MTRGTSFDTNGCLFVLADARAPWFDVPAAGPATKPAQVTALNSSLLVWTLTATHPTRTHAHVHLPLLYYIIEPHITMLTSLPSQSTSASRT